MNKTAKTLNWDDIEVVVFDLDGTLYNQKRLRMIMMFKLLHHAATTGSLDTLRVIRAFREYREVLAEASPNDFIDQQYEEPAFACDCSAASVRAIVTEWMEQRPLPYLRSCRFPGVSELFDTLRRAGKTIAVLSDYPAEQKLKALSLRADIVVSAVDEDVRCLKPETKGMQKILDRLGVRPERGLMIGDRYERDWMVADRIGMPAMILAKGKEQRCATFGSYRDDVFMQLAASATADEPVSLSLQQRHG